MSNDSRQTAGSAAVGMAGTVGGSALPAPPRPFGIRMLLFASLLLAFVWAAAVLDLRWQDLIPARGGVELAERFFARALSPALTSEARFVPPDTPSLLHVALNAAWTTLIYAAAAMGAATLGALVLGFFCSTAWWANASPDEQARNIRRGVGPAVTAVCRAGIAVMRSVHELMWAVLLLAAFGLSPVAAVIAIAIPACGTLAKVFSEMIDEAPRDGSLALQAAGASPLQVYCFGLLPGALPDMTAYGFYRFECALRSSAILGFFGFPTLGLYIRQSFNSTNYGEVWLYLYCLMALIGAFELWSGWVRGRIAQ